MYSVLYWTINYLYLMFELVAVKIEPRGACPELPLLMNLQPPAPYIIQTLRQRVISPWRKLRTNWSRAQTTLHCKMWYGNETWIASIYSPTRPMQTVYCHIYVIVKINYCEACRKQGDDDVIKILWNTKYINFLNYLWTMYTPRGASCLRRKRLVSGKPVKTLSKKCLWTA